MFISRGRTVALYDASRRSLAEVLKDHNIPYSRVIYHAADGSTYSIEYDAGDIKACIMVTRGGSIVQGDPCLLRLAELLHQRTGMIEVLELTPSQVKVDLDYNPHSLVSDRVKRSFMERVKAKPPSPPSTTAAPPTPRRVERKEAATAQPPRATEKPMLVERGVVARTELREVEETREPVGPSLKPIEVIEATGLNISDSFDFNLAARVMIEGSEVPAEGVEAESCLDIVTKILPLTATLYLYCSDGTNTLRMIVNTGKSVIHAMTEREGKVSFGVKALEDAKAIKASRIKLYLLGS